MAIFKGKIRQRNSGGTYDYLLPETTIDMVNGLQDELDNKVTIENMEKLDSDITQRGYNLKRYGAKGDKLQDDTEALRDLITSLKNHPNVYSDNKIIFPSGNYLITETISIPMYLRFKSEGNVKITYTGEGALFHVYNDKNPQQDNLSQTATNVGDIFEGSFYLQGTDSPGTCAIKLGEDVLNISHVTHTAWGRFSNIYIEKFDIGILFTQIQTYINRFENLTFSHCNTIISSVDRPAQNAGELITWNNCGFHNSGTFLTINSEINHSFVNCSIDFNTIGIIISGKNRFNTQKFTNCWIEASNDDTRGLVESSDTQYASYLLFDKCHFFFRNKTPRELFKGKLSISLTDCDFTINTFSGDLNIKNKAEGQMLCDDLVRIMNINRPIFHENNIGVSRKQNVINLNNNFELGEVDSPPLNFTFGGMAGKVLGSGGKFSSRCLQFTKASNNYFNCETEKVLIGAYKYVHGSIAYLSTSTTANIQTIVSFYAEDKVTLLKRYSIPQNRNNIDTSLYQRLQIGFGTSGDEVGDNNYIPVPPQAVYVSMNLIMGNLLSDVIIDNFTINGV